MNTVKTRKIRTSDVALMQRVQVTTGRYDGQLGWITGIDEGCACSAGWIRIYLDNGEHEEFRYGLNGDRSDLRLVIEEENAPKLEFLGSRNAKVGQAVKIWPGSRYGDNAARGTGKLVSLDGSWGRIQFADGFSDEFPLGTDGATVMVSTDPIPEMPEFVTRQNAKRGMLVTINPGNRWYHRQHGHRGKASILSIEGNEAKLEFADGYRDWFYFQDSGAVMIKAA